VGGKLIKLINRPRFGSLDETYFIDPHEAREIFRKRGWKTIAGFQTRNPIHRAHEYLTKIAIESLDGVLITL
jgi:sulfate adenylyltransferase